MKRIYITMLVCIYSIVLLAIKNTVEYNGCFYEYDTETGDAKCVKAPNESHVYPADIVIADVITVGTVNYPVVLIDNEVFFKCKSLKTVKLGANIKQIGRFAFDSSSLENVIFNEKLEYIDYNGFCQCENLRHIELPKSLKNIGFHAFSRCGIKKLILNYDVTIGEFAFWLPECEEFIFNDGFTSLDAWVFISPLVKTLNFAPNTICGWYSINCSSLKTIVLPQNTLKNEYTFAKDYAMKEPCPLEKFINYNVVPPIIGERMFPDEVFANCTLVVPDESIDAYRNAPGWCKFGSIKGLAGVDDVASDTPEVVSREYFNVNGQKIDAPQKGALSIERAVMTDGSVRVSKISC